MRSALLAILVLCAATVRAGEPVDPAALSTTITRGLEFLAQDAIAWKTEYTCASCHHAALTVWAFREAKERGLSVDDTLTNELNALMAGAGDGKFNFERPAGKPNALSTKALYFSLALAQNPAIDAVSDDGTKLLLGTVKAEQTADGSWSAWPEVRPPVFPPSDDCATAIGVLAMLPAAAAGDTEAVAARDKGIAWLESHPADDDPQSLATRVILWQRLDRAEDESQPWVDQIRARQNEDGGWSQAADMSSDAWATGQALYALAVAGAAADDPAVARGHAFLVTTQRDDGSWLMTSRPMTPGGEGAKNLVPITGAGAAWAVLGLVRSRR